MYSMSDTRVLFMISIYRSMGFSLPKIKEMLQEMTSSEVKKSFDERIEEVNAEIQKLIRKKEELEEYKRSIQRAEERANQFWIEDADQTMLAVMKDGSGKSLENKKENRLVEYQKLAPHVRQGFIISKEIWNQESVFDFQYGVFVSRKYAEECLSKEELDRHLITVGGPVAKMMIKTDGESLSRKTFEPFFEWIEKQGLKINSDLYGVVRYHAYYEHEVTCFEFLVSVV